MVELAIERWASVWPEGAELARAHAGEVEASRHNLDVELFEQLDQSGALLIATARDEGALVGYCMWTIGAALDDAGALVAEQRPWFVRPDRRGLGIALLRFSFDQLRARGVGRAFPHHWGNARVGRLFEALGARPREWVYEMEL